MNLYILKDDEPDWDEYDGFAVYADTAVEARQMAQDLDHENTTYNYAERPQKWLNPEFTSCEQQAVAVATVVPAGIALSGFHAG